MDVRIDSLKDRPRKLVFDEPIANFPVLADLAAQGSAEFRGSLAVDLTAIQAGEIVEVEGTLSCTVVLSCSRCLQPVEQRLDVEARLSFIHQPQGSEEVDGERELSESEVGLIAFDSETIDLRPAIEQELLMALPQHPLCRDDCAGLCPVCGGDRNLKPCDCAPPVFHGGFAALRNFKVSDQG